MARSIHRGCRSARCSRTPDPVAEVDGRRLGQQSALAVSDHDHVAQCRNAPSPRRQVARRLASSRILAQSPPRVIPPAASLCDEIRIQAGDSERAVPASDRVKYGASLFRLSSGVWTTRHRHASPTSATVEASQFLRISGASSQRCGVGHRPEGRDSQRPAGYFESHQITKLQASFRSRRQSNDNEP